MSRQHGSAPLHRCGSISKCTTLWIVDKSPWTAVGPMCKYLSVSPLWVHGLMRHRDRLLVLSKNLRGLHAPYQSEYFDSVTSSLISPQKCLVTRQQVSTSTLTSGKSMRARSICHVTPQQLSRCAALLARSVQTQTCALTMVSATIPTTATSCGERAVRTQPGKIRLARNCF